ncbi:Cupredoxin [Aspergillus karnatakaensis]|uniref:Cupredoxin n=1 Tax=Aspergillus karnatakaensis TaxID=1810916 RepID=UPI003CCE3B78
MLLSSLLLLVYTFCASASWVFNHEYDLETRSWVSNSLNNARSQYTRRQDDPENISVAGGPGHGPCRPGDRNCYKHCNPHPTTTRTTTRTTATTTSTKTTTTTTSHPTATPCAGNTPSTRSQWCSHSISTDYHSITPNTGITREYWLEVDEMIGSPDGFPRHVFAINGTIPGPTLYADWGDNLVIHVRNHMHETLNGTSIHWHGIRQQNSNMDDGVVSITQCPITPNDEYTYRWRAQQYGTSWYHSHMGLQAWDGVAGGLVINGPATANYDHDAGVVMLSDWTHQTADELFWVAQVSGPPELSNVLINGTNVYGGSGERFKLKVERGESYRLRLVNGALDTHFKFMIDHHVLEVIAMDLVPVKPFVVESVSLAMGQRYDVIVHANQAAIADSFWLRAIPQQACSEIENKDIWGIFYYGDTPTEPTTSPFLFNDTCQDEPMDSLIPYVPRTVQPPDWQENTLATVGRNPQNLFRWFLNSTSMLVYWEDPTLLQIADGDNVYAESSAVIDLPNGDEWVYLIVNTTIPVSHPIHLHGHDFFILAQGTNPWDGVVKLDNPPRRDTAVLPGNGYLVMAWETDNPGAWLMHCHIGWHTTEGFALQFVERKEEILSVIDEGELRRQCEKWSGYDVEFEVEQHDSGV